MSQFLQCVGKHTKKFKDITISDTKIQRQAFENTRVHFLDNILTELEAGFPFESQNIMGAFVVLGLRGILFIEEEELKDWRNDKLEVLIKKYGGDGGYINPTDALLEYGQLKHLVQKQRYPTDNIPALWKLICSVHGEMFPNLITLANIAHVFPVHTADVEGGFSAQNHIKNYLRNRISSERLNTLMTIKVEGPQLKQFDYCKALKVFRD